MPRPDSLAAFFRENGLLLTAQKVSGAALRRARDKVLAHRLRTHGLRIGKDPKLAGLAHMRIGENLSAGNGLWLDAVTFFAGHSHSPLLMLGPNCNLSDYVHIACTNRVTIGEGLLCGSRVIISDHAHGWYAGARQSAPTEMPASRPLTSDGTVTIGSNVWIGDGAAILAGANIGDGCIIGANSVVSGRLSANSIAAGAPARILRIWHEPAGEWRPVERDALIDTGAPSAIG